MSYKLAIFDLDGTILDTLDDLADSVNHALTKNSLPARTVPEIRAFVGNGIRSLIERSVPSGTDTATTDSVFEEFRTYYKAHSAEKTCPYDGIIDMLNRLRTRGVRLAVLSNKADFAVQALCEKYFSGIFDYVAGEKPNVPRKPAPDAVNAILAEFSIPREEAVYIGDSDVDVETARNASIDCISVTWGFRDEDVLTACGAVCIAHTVQELGTAILE